MDDHISDRGHFSMWPKMAARRDMRHNYFSPRCKQFSLLKIYIMLVILKWKSRAMSRKSVYELFYITPYLILILEDCSVKSF